MRTAVGVTDLRPRRRQPLVGRHDEVITQYRSGRLLREIGESFGVTHEAIRLVLSQHGITRKDGGAHKRIEDRVVRRLIDRAKKAKPCSVCRSWVLRTRGGMERTCSTECAKAWDVLRYILDPSHRERHQLRIADWMVRNPEKVKPSAFFHATRLLLGETPLGGHQLGRRWVIPGSRVHRLAVRYGIPHEVAGRAA